MRPVLRGFLSYSSIFDGSVTLGQIMFLNECIDINDENERRITKYYESRNGNA